MSFFRSLGQTFLEADRVQCRPHHCLRAFSPLASCAICSQVCPQKAIAMTPAGPVIDNSCQGCGLCVKNCPTGALSLSRPSHFQGEGDRLVLRCREDRHTLGAPNRIPCFSSLRLEDLLGFLDGFASIHFVADCEGCPKTFQPLVITSLLDKHGISYEDRLFFHAREDDGQSRRDFLAGLGKGAGRLGQEKGSAWILSSLPQIGESSGPLAQPLRALQSYLKSHPVAPDHRLPYEVLDCHACCFCGACLQVCPTAALSIQREEDQVALVQDPAACLSCQLCLEACFQGDLRMVRPMTAADLVAEDQRVLARGHDRTCPDCGLTFTAQDDSDLCPACRPSA